MYRPIAISLSPNTEKDDVVTALRALFIPNVVQNSNSTLSSQIRKYFGKSYSVFTLNSGRSALFLILKALNLPKGSEVVTQAYTCVAVPNAAIWNNLIPIYADIDERLNINPKSLEQKITKKTRAVLVQHTFGIPADIKEIIKVIHKKEKEFSTKIILIEDCAHSLGLAIDNKKAGTFSDVAFLSFGRDKVISSVFGGVIISNNQRLVHLIESEYNKLKNPPLLWTIQQLFHPLLFNFVVLPFYNFGFNKITIGKLALLFFQKLRMLSKPVYKAELYTKRPSLFPTKLPNQLAYLAINQFNKLERFNKKRVAIAREYTTNDFPTIPAYPKGTIYLRYPFYHKEARKFYSFAKKKGFLLGNWYTNILDPKTDLSRFYYKSGSCPKAEKASKTIINLPTYPVMTKNDIKKIIDLTKSWLDIQ